MKVCLKCNLSKDFAEFSKKLRNKDGLQSSCKQCHTEYLKEHYINNKNYYKLRAKESKIPRRIVTLQWVINYLKEHPCVDCGEADPIVLEFDHLRDKYKSISSLVSALASIDLIQEEIDKCEVRCANCHRKKTAAQLEWYKGIDVNPKEISSND